MRSFNLPELNYKYPRGQYSKEAIQKIMSDHYAIIRIFSKEDIPSPHLTNFDLDLELLVEECIQKRLNMRDLTSKDIYKILDEARIIFNSESPINEKTRVKIKIRLNLVSMEDI